MRRLHVLLLLVQEGSLVSSQVQFEDLLQVSGVMLASWFIQAMHVHGLRIAFKPNGIINKYNKYNKYNNTIRGCFIPTRQAIGPDLFHHCTGGSKEKKKREYGERINEVEHGSFTPLVFSSCGGMGPEAAVVIKKLANALATKRRVAYSRVVSWLRCCLSFSLARSAIRCIRGLRSVHRQPFVLAPVDLVQAEARLIYLDSYMYMQ